jgi:hypothetical protein
MFWQLQSNGVGHCLEMKRKTLCLRSYNLIELATKALRLEEKGKNFGCLPAVGGNEIQHIVKYSDLLAFGIRTGPYFLAMKCINTSRRGFCRIDHGLRKYFSG